jgi:hypothetical protein
VIIVQVGSALPSHQFLRLLIVVYNWHSGSAGEQPNGSYIYVEFFSNSFETLLGVPECSDVRNIRACFDSYVLRTYKELSHSVLDCAVENLRSENICMICPSVNLPLTPWP